MGDKSDIEWTDATWSPIVGCTRCDPGCENCYSEELTATRLASQRKYKGLAVINAHGDARWTGELRFDPPTLSDPLRWARPRMVFVCSMSDLHHERNSTADVAAVYGVMSLAHHHTFQVLTKRADRRAAFFREVTRQDCVAELARRDVLPGGFMRRARLCSPARAGAHDRWPLPNVWHGVSASTRKGLDDRWRGLYDTPAVVRFLSLEPLLEHVVVDDRLNPHRDHSCARGGVAHNSSDMCAACHDGGDPLPAVDWVIVGGESAKKRDDARPFNVAWARSIVAECRASKVPVFVKQLGAEVLWDGDVATPDAIWPEGTKMVARPGAPARVLLRHRKGADPAEWPADLRVREMPRELT
jgi:protein gp37